VIVMPNSSVESCTVKRISHCRPLMLKRLSAGGAGPAARSAGRASAGSDRGGADEGRPASANDTMLHADGAPSQPLCHIFRRRAILTRDREPDHLAAQMAHIDGAVVAERGPVSFPRAIILWCSARRSTARSTSCRPTSMPGSPSTMNDGPIRAAGASASPRCRPCLTRCPWRRRRSWLLDNGDA
jgi:hypothetical protein